jgi:hypothetical protein
MNQCLFHFMAVAAVLSCDTAGDGNIETADSRGSDGDADADPLAQYRVACLERINGFRATLNLAPYERWRDAETCSDDQARQDSNTQTAHGAFGKCGELAQNECPGWGSYDDVIQNCLQTMWDEGPGSDFTQHGHFINMSSTSYTRAACGFYQTTRGEVWAVQNFR